MNEVFDACVQFLEWLGPLVGMTYKEINVWLFCILGPIVFLVMLVVILRQRNQLRHLKRKNLSPNARL